MIVFLHSFFPTISLSPALNILFFYLAFSLNFDILFLTQAFFQRVVHIPTEEHWASAVSPFSRIQKANLFLITKENITSCFTGLTNNTILRNNAVKNEQALHSWYNLQDVLGMQLMWDECTISRLNNILPAELIS